jgi:hypothetical protein
MTLALSPLSNRIERLDFFRRSPATFGGRTGHKEWHHFCVLGPEVDFLANFSMSDDVRAGAAPGDELPRLGLRQRALRGLGQVVLFNRGAHLLRVAREPPVLRADVALEIRELADELRRQVRQPLEPVVDEEVHRVRGQRGLGVAPARVGPRVEGRQASVLVGI